MKMMPTIYKYMRPFFKERGFSYKRGSFYMIQNDIMFGVYFGRPSDSVYVHFYILPLYMKTDFHHITYGDRIMYQYLVELPSLDGSYDEEGVAVWCSILQKILRDDIFAFFEQISSPEKLLDCIDQNPETIDYYFFCERYRVDKIRVYTCLYLHKYDRIAKGVERCLHQLEKTSFSSHIKESERQELLQLERISMCGDDVVDEFFRQVVKESISVCV